MILQTIDFGNYNQNGTIETDLVPAQRIRKFDLQGTYREHAGYADMAKPQYGGQLKVIHLQERKTYTNFTGVASGKFPRNQR
jgi:alpha-amylase